MTPFRPNPQKAENGNATNTVPSSSLLIESLVDGISIALVTNGRDHRAAGETLSIGKPPDQRLRVHRIVAPILLFEVLAVWPSPGQIHGHFDLDCCEIDFRHTKSNL